MSIQSDARMRRIASGVQFLMTAGMAGAGFMTRGNHPAQSIALFLFGIVCLGSAITSAVHSVRPPKDAFWPI